MIVMWLSSGTNTNALRGTMCSAPGVPARLFTLPVVRPRLRSGSRGSSGGLRFARVSGYAASKLILAVAIAAGGCQTGARKPISEPDVPAGTDVGPFSSRSTGGLAPDSHYYVQYDVLRVEVPPGSVSRSEKLWNHVDESVLDFATARRLRRNGFRVGLTDPAVWPAIKAVLDSMGAAQAMQVGLTQTDMLPFAIQIDPTPRDRTIFLFGNGDKLEGFKFAQCVNYLRIEHRLDPDRPLDFRLRLTPEIRHAHTRTTLAATEAGLREVPVYEGRLYGEISAELLVPQKGILVVGPSERAGRRFQIGTEFLCDDRNGAGFERILFITPHLGRMDTHVSG